MLQASLAALAAAAILTVLVAWPGIVALRRLKAGQRIRDDGPNRHLAKAGTPTMGGLLFMAAITATVLALSPLTPAMVIFLAASWGFGLVGLADDFLKVVLRRPLGLLARQKLGGQLILGLAAGTAVAYWAGRGTDLAFAPLGWSLELGWIYIPFACFLLIATSNAINLTDGLDGLAAGITLWVALAYLLVALHLDRADLAICAGAVAGGCLGFLAFNFHPARVFMGDTGSMALGGAIGALALLTGTELVLPVLGGVYAVETLSVILQVISFQCLRRRLFRMSPLHHHFELLGWPEVRVVLFFWLMAIALAGAGLMLV